MKESCSWCHHMNDAGQVSCESCGHDAHAARTACRCSRCQPQVHQTRRVVHADEPDT